MSYALQLLPVVLPILFWGIYHYHKDRHLPEPVSSLVLAFGLGLVSAAISRALYTALGWASLRYDAFALADGNTLSFDFDDEYGRPVQQAIGAIYAAGSLPVETRPVVFDAVRSALVWGRPVDAGFIGAVMPGLHTTQRARDRGRRAPWPAPPPRGTA